MKTMNYRERVRHFYKKARSDGHRASQALCIAHSDAKYGEGSTKLNVFDNPWGYEGVNTITLPFGFKLKFEIQHDNDHEPPWEDCDGMGVVTDWIHGCEDEEKYGWELCGERFSHRYYDWRATLPEAVRDGWDAAPYGTGTKIERAMRAMKSTYEYLREWCNDDWWYVGYIVTLLDADDNEIDSESCWGYESKCMDYVASCARDAAARMLRKAHREFFKDRGDEWKQYELQFEEAA